MSTTAKDDLTTKSDDLTTKSGGACTKLCHLSRSARTVGQSVKYVRICIGFLPFILTSFLTNWRDCVRCR